MLPDPRPPAAHEYNGRDLEAMAHAHHYHRWILDRLAPYLGATVAEVGAGVGNFSRLILETGITRLTAFEPSGKLYPLLKSALSHDPRAQAIHAFFGPQAPPEPFDSVLYINVLEHIEHDAAEIAATWSALKPGGHLLIFVPALPWLYGEPDKQIGHYRRYTRPQLIDIAQRAGFSIIDARYFDLAGVVPWYLLFVLMKRSLSPGSVSIYDRWVVPIMRRLENRIPPPIGKNLLLIAHKPIKPNKPNKP